MGKNHRYSDEEIDFVRNYAFGHSRQDITDRFNEHFNLDLSVGQITSTLKRYGINTGLTGTFQKGMTPHNKGKKMSAEVYKKLRHTMFKKGNNINCRPVGSERITKDGYIEIKIANPNKWQSKHITIWESHNGKVPKNHCVIFLDGDKRNLDIDNLALISREENLFLNKNKLRFDDKEITQSAINLAKLNIKILERSK